MNMYQLFGVLGFVWLVITVAGGLAVQYAAGTRWTWAAVIPVSTGVGMYIMGLRRKVVRAALGRKECPKCRGALRHYPGEETSFYCRECELGFTDLGRTIKPDDDDD